MTAETDLIYLERQKATFCVEEITNIFDGGRDKTVLRRKVERIVGADKKLCIPDDFEMLSREKRFTDSVKRSVYMYTTFWKKQGWDWSDSHLYYLTRTGRPREASLTLHVSAFTPCIYSFGSAEQIEKWAPLAKEMHIIGAYAQTELGHGTYLKGLETTATYDRSSEEFVINSPSVSAAKWWPGDMGKCANHVLLMADLIIDGRSLGMHPFMVQIRDLTTHMPLPGIEVGDIGDKFALTTTDNGYLLFDHFRIPRENLLAKNAEVRRDGSYVRKASDRMMYASMVRLRSILLGELAVMPLAKAATIAVRYSAVRKQGKLDSGGEIPILDYVAQQHKLLPQVAAAHALNIACTQLYSHYQECVVAFEHGDLEALPELHSLSAAMKASASEQASTGIETARRACGGHGFSHASGLMSLYTLALGCCTIEGENTVLYLQCARFLMKCAAQAAAGAELSAGAAFLNDANLPQLSRASSFSNPQLLAECFQHVSRECVMSSAQKLQGLLEAGESHGAAWNFMSVQLVHAAKSYAMQHIVSSFARHVVEIECSAPVRAVLTQLCCLYAVHHINENIGYFARHLRLSSEQCELAYDAEIQLLAQLRPNAVAIVDAFDFSDNSLCSCLGSYDGNAYERLFSWARKAPLNRTEVHEPTYKYLRPHLHRGRDILKRQQAHVNSKL